MHPTHPIQDYLVFQADFNDPEIVALYDELPFWSAMFGQMMLEHLALRPGVNVLDVGCGTGFPLVELAQRLGSTCTVHGLDPWEAALERAQRKAQTRGVKNIRLCQGDAAAMPFPANQFDLMVSNLGLNNFASPKQALQECWRVSRPGARLVLTTNLKGHMHEFYEIFESTLRERGDLAAVEALGHHIDHRATLPGLSALLETTGYKVSQVREATARMRFLDGSALLNHYFIKLGFLDGWKSVVEPPEQPAVFARLEENLNRYASSQGELALSIPMAYVEANKIEQGVQVQ